MTIFGVWLGWNLKIVRERKAIRAELERLSKVETDDGNGFTLFRYEGLESQEAIDPIWRAQTNSSLQPQCVFHDSGGCLAMKLASCSFSPLILTRT